MGIRVMVMLVTTMFVMSMLPLPEVLMRVFRISVMLVLHHILILLCQIPL